MKMDEKTYNRLTKKERDLISDIESKASKRRHKKTFTVKFIMKHLTDHSYLKGWTYDEKADVTDMIKSVAKLALDNKFFTKKEAEEYIEYYSREYASNWFPDKK